jgi:GxxExxY protein
MNNYLIYQAESFRIRNACFEVYKEKGCGFTEPVYQECIELEMTLQRLPFDAQRHVPLDYKGHQLKSRFMPDLICFDKIVVELKAVSKLADEHRSQVINYLKATGFRVGLLVNFGSAGGVEIERFAN